MQENKPNDIFKDEQLSDLISSSFKSIKDKVSDELVKEIGNSLQWRLKDRYVEKLDEFIKLQLEPEIDQMLLKNKVKMAEAISKEIENIGTAIGEKVQEKIISIIAKGSSYEIKKLIEAIL